MDWSALPFFLAVAETGSQSAAARKLRVSQPTVGRYVAALEAALGSRLFDRTSQGLQLTPAGERLLSHTQRMQQEAQAVERELQGADTRLRGIVKISASEGLASYWLTPALTAFTAAHPGIRVEVVSNNTAVNLPRREADIAIRMFPPEHNDLIGRYLAHHVVALFASEDYLAHHPAPQSVADLAQHALVGFDDTLGYLPQAVWMENNCPEDRFVFRCNSLLVQLEATRNGWGIGAHSCVAAAQFPNLIRVLPEIEVTRQEMWLIVHSDLRRSARIRAVYDFLADRITEQRAAFEGRAENK
jgi:DNA-binding transcriptional LysR family regulator